MISRSSQTSSAVGLNHYIARKRFCVISASVNFKPSISSITAFTRLFSVAKTPASDEKPELPEVFGNKDAMI
jgi:hypothetical protein